MDDKNVKLIEETAAEWWDVSGIQKGLHAMNPLRVRFIIEGLINTGLIRAENKNKPDVLKGIKILDVGCGAGILTEALAKLKADVTGLDPSKELVKIARDHLDGQSIHVEYITEFIEDYAIKNAEKYDVVVASEVIEHVPEKRSFLKGMAKCVKPNGSIFITTPNRSIVSWFTTIIAELIKVLQKNSHDWRQFITPSEVGDILNEVNCDTALVCGMWYTPFFNTFCFIPYHGIMYALQAVKNGGKKQK